MNEDKGCHHRNHGRRARTDAPYRRTIWPVEGDQFGIDVRWGGATGNGRATVVARLLEGAGIRGRLTLRPPEVMEHWFRSK